MPHLRDVLKLGIEVFRRYFIDGFKMRIGVILYGKLYYIGRISSSAIPVRAKGLDVIIGTQVGAER